MMIRYGTGEIYNFGIQSVHETRTLRKLECHPAYTVLPSHSDYFDFEYLIPHTTAGKIVS